MENIELVKNNVAEHLEGVELENILEDYNDGCELINIVTNMIYDAISNEKKCTLTDIEWNDLITSLIHDSFALGYIEFLLLMCGHDFDELYEEKDGENE